MIPRMSCNTKSFMMPYSCQWLYHCMCAWLLGGNHKRSSPQCNSGVGANTYPRRSYTRICFAWLYDQADHILGYILPSRTTHHNIKILIISLFFLFIKIKIKILKEMNTKYVAAVQNMTARHMFAYAKLNWPIISTFFKTILMFPDLKYLKQDFLETVSVFVLNLKNNSFPKLW